MIVHVKNTEACWVEYGYAVELPDALTSEEEIRYAALEAIDADGPNVELTYSGNIRGTVEFIDQDYEITDIERGGVCDECGAVCPPHAQTVEGRWHESACSLRTDNIV